VNSIKGERLAHRLFRRTSRAMGSRSSLRAGVWLAWDTPRAAKDSAPTSRSVPLNESVMAAVKIHRLGQNEEKLRLGELWEYRGLIFPDRVGKPMDPSNVYHRVYKRLLQKAGLRDQDFTFHSLRHTFVTESFTRGKYPKIVQSLLGHSSITQTMDRYSHLLEGIGSDAVEGLEESFG
jgi:integrase